jgi:transposase
VPAIWLPTPELRRERERSGWRLHLVKHRSTLKNRVHSTLITFGHQVPMADLFGLGGRRLLRELDIPEPWRGHVDASVELIDELELRISQIEAELQRSGADHRYVPILMTAPGFGWITSFTVACELGEITRFSTPTKFVGYTGLCPRVSQSGEVDLRGPVSKRGPRYLRWGLMEAAIHAAPHPLYRGALPAAAAPPWPPARRQGRADRSLPPARHRDLVHADPQPTLRSGRRHFSSGCLTAHLGIAPPERLR